MMIKKMIKKDHNENRMHFNNNNFVSTFIIA